MYIHVNTIRLYVIKCSSTYTFIVFHSSFHDIRVHVMFTEKSETPREDNELLHVYFI